MKKLMKMVKKAILNGVHHFGDLNTTICCAGSFYEPKIPTEIEK